MRRAAGRCGAEGCRQRPRRRRVRAGQAGRPGAWPRGCREGGKGPEWPLQPPGATRAPTCPLPSWGNRGPQGAGNPEVPRRRPHLGLPELPTHEVTGARPGQARLPSGRRSPGQGVVPAVRAPSRQPRHAHLAPRGRPGGSRRPRPPRPRAPGRPAAPPAGGVAQARARLCCRFLPLSRCLFLSLPFSVTPFPSFPPSPFLCLSFRQAFVHSFLH